MLAWNKEHDSKYISFSLFLLVLIISISTHLFIHLTTQKEREKKYKENIFFLNSKTKRREYLATGSQGQNSRTFVCNTTKEKNHIVSFSYYFQLKHSLI